MGGRGWGGVHKDGRGVERGVRGSWRVQEEGDGNGEGAGGRTRI